MFTEITNIICKIAYALYGVKINAQNVLLSHIDVLAPVITIQL